MEGNVLWAGTSGGVLRWDILGNDYQKYTTSDGLISNIVYAIAVDGAGNIWFGTNSGVSKFDGNHWTTYNENDGLASNTVYAIAVDSANELWFGGDKGVSQFDGANWTIDTPADGLAGYDVRSLAIDSRDRVWAGVYKRGVSQYTPMKLTLNYSTGAVGSYFDLIGTGYPANQSLTVTVNGNDVGTVDTDAAGTFSVTLDTTNADEGVYEVSAGFDLSVQFWLTATAPVHPQEGDYVIGLWHGIARTATSIYLPLVLK